MQTGLTEQDQLRLRSSAGYKDASRVEERWVRAFQNPVAHKITRFWASFAARGAVEGHDARCQRHFQAGAAGGERGEGLGRWLGQQGAAGGGNAAELFEVAPGVLSELSRHHCLEIRLEGLRICPEKLLCCCSTAPVGIGISRPCVAAVLWAASVGCNRAQERPWVGFTHPEGNPPGGKPTPGPLELAPGAATAAVGLPGLPRAGEETRNSSSKGL